jgi:hypothetical protein
MRKDVNYRELDLANKWKILGDQWRFFLWSVYTALGGITFGFDGLITYQALAMVTPQSWSVLTDRSRFRNNMESRILLRQAGILSQLFGRAFGTGQALPEAYLAN